jgi:hypothetical protein
MYSILAMFVNKAVFAASSLYLAAVIVAGVDPKYLIVMAVGAIVEQLIEPTCEVLAHRSPWHLRMLWIYSWLLLLLIPISPAVMIGVIWGWYMAIGKAMAMKVLPKVQRGAVFMVMSGLLCSVDPLLLVQGWWWGPGLMPIVSSVFLLFIETERGEIEVKELVSVTIKVFGSSLVSKGLYSALIVSMPALLAAEKAVKGVAGIPAGILKLLASVKEEQLKVTRVIAGVLSVMTVAFDWRTSFSILYALKKATMDRKLEFDGFATKIALKNILECVICGCALWAGGSGSTIFILLQAVSLVVWTGVRK